MCAIFGIYGVRKAAEITGQALHSQQHRAEDYAGIASSNGTDLFDEYGAGLVQEALTKEKLNRLHGSAAIGHTRYPTVVGEEELAKKKGLFNVQPIEGMYGAERFFLAHNGNIVNYDALKLQFSDIRFKTTVDSEIIVRLLERTCTGNLIEDLRTVMQHLEGSGSLLILFKDRLVAIRDPSGCKPLIWGRLADGYVFSSEDCAFETIDATYEGEVPAGTVVIVENGERSVHPFARARLKKCLFELLYLGHPTSSKMFGLPILAFRESTGELMEQKYPVPGADIVIGIPDSGVAFAAGYAKSGRSGRLSLGITRHHHTGRTFIQATDNLQLEKARQKYQRSRHAIHGKKVVLVDDSIVRLTTAPIVAKMVWDAGAAEVHFRIAYPPIEHPCFYGVKMETRDKLIAANATIEEIAKKINATSLAYTTLDDLYSLIPDRRENFCDACVTGNYWHKAA